MLGIRDYCEPPVLAFHLDSSGLARSLPVKALVLSDEVVEDLIALEDGGIGILLGWTPLE